MSTNTFFFCLTAHSLLNDNVYALHLPNYGDMEGEVNSAGVRQYMTIPYAKPPIDDLRWAPPQPADPWQGVLDTTIQDTPSCLCDLSEGRESEDCLYLNIWAPSDAQYNQTKYAVMIYLHGGSFDKGESDHAAYDPTMLVKNIGDVIVVTPNYRLGLFGFLFDNTYETGVEGNFGIMDQEMAIKWVHDNIAYFGGNEEDITLFGQSAGATSVGIHLVYNNEYIKAGIMSSPALLAMRTPKTWNNVIENFNNLTGCASEMYSEDRLDCWRSVDSLELLAMQRQESVFGLSAESSTGQFAESWPLSAFGVTWTPTKYTPYLPNDPVFEYENIHTPPFIIGHTKDDFWIFITDTLLEVSREGTINYQFVFGFLTLWFGNPVVAAQALDTYGITDTETYSGSYLYDFATIQNDNWVCGIRNVLDNADSKRKLRPKWKKNYYYSFDVVDQQQFSTLLSAFGLSNSACVTRACHTIDLAYLFTPPVMAPLLNDDTITIGQEMQKLFTNYAKYLNPNEGMSAEVWPKYTNRGSKDNFLQIVGVNEFNANSTKNDNHFCKFWDEIGYAGEYQIARPNSLLELFTLIISTLKNYFGNTEYEVSDETVQNENSAVMFGEKQTAKLEGVLLVCIVVISVFIILCFCKIGCGRTRYQSLEKGVPKLESDDVMMNVLDEQRILL